MPRPLLPVLVATTIFAAGCAAAAPTTPSDLLASYQAAGAQANPARGQALFTTRHGAEWSCSSCHGAVPATPGRHVVTGKVIRPLAPAADAERFTDSAKTEKWFRRNCNDVLGRDCSTAEKADVLAWLIGIGR
jgi:hypothetical protein